MGDFVYERIDLDTLGFRLLRLFKGEYNDPIQCELFVAFLDDDYVPGYEAVSYTWGGDEKPCRMEVNGKPMAITQNLALALRHLRLPNQDRVLWADAACINQDDQKEKGHQVNNMRGIYKAADRVIVWLGPATFETDVAMVHLRSLAVESRRLPRTDPASAKGRLETIWRQLQEGLGKMTFPITQMQEGLRILLDRPWFRRVWILQEVANARSTDVVCGSKSVSGEVFAFAPYLLGVQASTTCQAVLDILSVASRNCSWWLQERDLPTLLAKFGQCEATDERDHVFALLGLSSDPGLAQHITANYERPLEDVVHDTTRYLLGLPENFPMASLSEWNMSRLRSLDVGYKARAPSTARLDALTSLRHKELLWVIQSQNIPLLKALTESGAVIPDLNDDWDDSILQRALLSNDESTLRIITKFCGITKLSDNDVARRAFFKAVGSGNLRELRSFLTCPDFNGDLTDSDGQSALVVAVVQQSDPHVVELLLNRTCTDVNLRDINGRTALSRAVLFSTNGPIVESLLRWKGIDVNSKDNEGKTALFRATAFNSHRRHIAEALLNHRDIDINARDNDGRTVLFEAIAPWCAETLFRLLLSQPHLSINAKDKDGRSALSWAVKHHLLDKNTDILIERSDFNVNSADNHGRTALSMAAERCVSRDYAVIKSLLRRKDINIDLADENGRTALSWATARSEAGLWIDAKLTGLDSGNDYMMNYAPQIVELLRQHRRQGGKWRSDVFS